MLAMHKTIKRFGLEGEINDVANTAVRHTFVKVVTDEMRGMGYVPILGLGPFWSFDYRAEEDLYKFVLSVHGVYVGRKRACTTDGITVEGREILLSTPPSKSNPSSSESE